MIRRALLAWATAFWPTPFKNFKELIDYVRSKPGKLNHGYTHAASGHMAMELMKLEAGKCAPGVRDCKGDLIGSSLGPQRRACAARPATPGCRRRRA
jgi:hypothetical protein